MKPPPSEEQLRADQRSLDEQRQIVGWKVIYAAGRWAARREQQREEAAREEAAQSSQALIDTGSTSTLVGEARPFYDEVIAELYERMHSPEAKAHPVFRTSERVRRRAEITFTEDQGPDGRAEPRFEHGIHEGRNWSDVAE